MFWVALGLLTERRRSTADRRLCQLQRIAFWLTVLVGYMVVSGGLVAGIRAGKAYNTFPLMNGALLPPESFLLEPWYLNFFNNMALVQFDHRLGAWLLACLVPWFWYKMRSAAVSPGARWRRRCCWGRCSSRSASASRPCCWPCRWVWGRRTRAGAMIVLGLLLWANHELRVPDRQPVSLMESPGLRLRKIRSSARLLTALSLLVVLLSAYLRLDGAGLGCADWPACYGQMLAGEPRAPNSAPCACCIARWQRSRCCLPARSCGNAGGDRRCRPGRVAGNAAAAADAGTVGTRHLELGSAADAGEPAEHPRRPGAGQLLLAGGTGQRAAGDDAAAARRPTVLLRLGAACLTLTVILGALIGAGYMALSVHHLARL
jgi:hypothetical protein